MEGKDNQTYGVLMLKLRATDYSWEFVHQLGAISPIPGQATSTKELS